jgi:hypothetical protein
MKLKRLHAIILFFILLAGYVYFFKVNNILENMTTMTRTTPYKSCNKTKCYEMCQSDGACLQGHDECEGCNLETNKGSTFSPVVISNTENIENNSSLLKKLNPSVVIVNDNEEPKTQVPIIQNHDPMFAPQKRTTGMLTDTNSYN